MTICEDTALELLKRIFDEFQLVRNKPGFAETHVDIPYLIIELSESLDIQKMRLLLEVLQRWVY